MWLYFILLSGASFPTFPLYLFASRESFKMRWQFLIAFASFASTKDVGVLKQLVKPFVSFSWPSFRADPRTADVPDYFWHLWLLQYERHRELRSLLHLPWSSSRSRAASKNLSPSQFCVRLRPLRRWDTRQLPQALDWQEWILRLPTTKWISTQWCRSTHFGKHDIAQWDQSGPFR